MSSATICSSHKGDYPVLTDIWEGTVQATHHFLSEADFDFYKSNLSKYFSSVELFIAKNNGIIEGFIGVSNSEIELLFIREELRGKGVGKRLLSYAVDVLKKKKVSVNEQNEQAVLFYKHLGFKAVGRSEYDAEGKHYPYTTFRNTVALMVKKRAGVLHQPFYMVTWLCFLVLYDSTAIIAFFLESEILITTLSLALFKSIFITLLPSFVPILSSSSAIGSSK